MTLTDEINRLDREIDGLKREIRKNPQGRYIRALEARERDYGKLVIKQAFMGPSCQFSSYSLSARISLTANSTKPAEVIWGAA